MKTILVIDDDLSDLATTVSALKKNKYNVLTANNSDEALALLKRKKIHLIIIDILMPKLSGYGLMRILREKYNHHIKMAYITIIPQKEVDMTGIDGFIQKPFELENLLKEVKKLLK